MSQPEMIHGAIPHWVCVACSAIQPKATVGMEYPTDSCTCGSSDFIADTLPPLYREKAIAACDHQRITNDGFCPSCGIKWSLPT